MNNNVRNMFVKKSNKQKEIECLKETMSINTEALDYLQTCLNVVNDRLSYNEEDKQAQYDKKQLEYIKYCLYYLDDMYIKSFKQLGGKL